MVKKKQKYYIIYKTTNQVNGKYYIGQHITTNRDDTYLGSGVVLNSAIAKYGRENFKREILHSFDNFEDMDAKERELITEDVVRDRMSYNVQTGGQSIVVSKEATRFSGKKHTEESKRLMSRHHNRAARSVISKKNWADPDLRKRMNVRRKQKIVTCPHCMKVGGKNAMIRYHFDNCKMEKDTL